MLISELKEQIYPILTDLAGIEDPDLTVDAMKLILRAIEDCGGDIEDDLEEINEESDE